MSQEPSDRELGMGRRITRRDFLNGMAVGIGVLGSAGFAELASAADGAADAGHSAKWILSAGTHGYEGQPAGRL